MTRSSMLVAAVASGVCGIIGGALIAEAWGGEAPKKTAVPAGIGFLALSALLAFEGSRYGEKP